MAVLDWLGKQAVTNHHQEVPYKLLHCDGELSVGSPDHGNLIIEGDNLEALKSLLPYYRGQVDCIFIDPPYNTGKTKWVYNDNVNSPEIREWIGKVVGKEAEDLSRHDKWLCMMYPRLRLLKEFLSENGILWITLDDNESHRGKLLLDEIFGQKNFISNLIWNSTKSVTNKALISEAHTHVLLYAKEKKYYVKNRELLRLPESGVGFSNPDNDPRGAWKADPFTVGGWRVNQQYEIKNPNTGQIYKPPKNGSWKNEKTVFDKLISDNRIVFGASGDAGPQRKRFLSEALARGQVSTTLWTDCETTTNATFLLQSIFNGQSPFETPKPLGLLKKIITYSLPNNGLILDSFAGSGTTAHAVLEANKLDGGNRKFILVEMDKNIAKPVTAERVRRVIDKYEFSGKKTSELHKEKLTQKKIENRDFNLSDIINDYKNRYDADFDKITSKIENDSLIINGETHVKDRTEGLGGGFRYCYLGTPLFNEYGDISKEVTFPDLAAHIFFSETGMPLPQKADGKTSLIGQIENKIVHLLFSPTSQGVPRETAGNVLTLDLLAALPQAPEGFEGQRVIYAEACTVNDDRLNAENVIFKHIPYHIEGVL